MNKLDLELTTYGPNNFRTLSLPDSHGRISQKYNLQLEVFRPHEEVLQRWITSGNMSDIKVFSLCSVDDTEVPVRWLANIAQPATLLDELRKVGIEPPKSWILMAPVNISAASNSRDVTAAVENARNLSRLAHLYLEEFHPNTNAPILETDHPEYPVILGDIGSRLLPALPSIVTQALQKMSLKRNNEGRALQQGAVYFASHPDTYGLLSPSLGWNHSRRRSIFILPTSERKFLDMMDLSQEAFAQIGLPLRSFDEEEIVIITSSALRSPHYYHHRFPNGQTEPLLREVRPDTWIPAKDWQQGTKPGIRDVNPNLKGELYHAIRLIEMDIGLPKDVTGLARLGRIVQQVY